MVLTWCGTLSQQVSYQFDTDFVNQEPIKIQAPTTVQTPDLYDVQQNITDGI